MVRFVTAEPSQMPGQMRLPKSRIAANAMPEGGQIAVAYPGGMASSSEPLAVTKYTAASNRIRLALAHGPGARKVSSKLSFSSRMAIIYAECSRYAYDTPMEGMVNSGTSGGGAALKAGACLPSMIVAA